MPITEHSTPGTGVASNPNEPNGIDTDITVISETGKRVVKIPAKTGFLLGITLALLLVNFLHILIG